MKSALYRVKQCAKQAKSHRGTNSYLLGIIARKLTKLVIVFLLCVVSSNMALSQSNPASNANGNNEEDLGIAIRPAQFDFRASRGQKIVTTVSISNSQNKPMQLKLAIGDWLRDSLGNHGYFEPSTLSVSCANWVKLSQTFVEVPAKGSANFELTFAAPDSANVEELMRWAMLFVEFSEERTIPKSDKPGVTTVFVKKQRIGLHIYQIPPGLNRKEVKMVDFKPVNGQKNTYRIAYRNTGDVQLVCKSYLELTSLDESGDTRKVESTPVPTFPDQYRVVDLEIPSDLPKGKYNVIAAVDGGEDLPLEAAQEEIEVK